MAISYADAAGSSIAADAEDRDGPAVYGVLASGVVVDRNGGVAAELLRWGVGLYALTTEQARMSDIAGLAPREYVDQHPICYSD